MLDETVQQEMVQQIDSVLKDGVREASDTQFFHTRAMALIDRLTPARSVYARMAATVMEEIRGLRGDRLQHILTALKADIEAGFLQTIEELVHASLFADILGQAEELLDHKYRDAAAVLVGGALEIHLRELAKKNGVSVEQTRKGKAVPRSVEDLTNGLTKQGVYNELTNKQVKAWYALRTAAAHGDYGKYEAADVKAMLNGVTNFMEKYSA